jgi:glycosyltransferase involved in cell wall biosynthesis
VRDSRASSRSRRVVLVAGELLGYPRCGGLGTATTFLGISLAQAGHRVEILCARSGAGEPLESTWGDVYAAEGVEVRMLEAPRDVEPSVLALPAAILAALRPNPPDIAIVQDWGGYGYAVLEARELGLAFPDTRFVVYAHGTRRWIAEAHGKVPDSQDSVAMSVLEQAAVESADAVVSPSRYLLQWMRDRGWRLPEVALTIPLITESAVFGTQAVSPPPSAPISKVAFFGRLEDRKGIEPFVAAFAGMRHAHLQRLELVFLGSPTVRWTPARIESELPRDVREALRGLEFRTTLSRSEALAVLRRPGTLAVIPSLDDNSPSTVYECLENDVPFLASAVGGIPELVAEEDRARVLVEPSAEGIREGLERALVADPSFAPARPAVDGVDARRAWEDVVGLDCDARAEGGNAEPTVTAVVAAHTRGGTLDRCLAALARQRYRPLEIVVASPERRHFADDHNGRTRLVKTSGGSVTLLWQAGVRASASEWALLLVDSDTADETLVDVLVRAQESSGADVVTCGIASAAGFGEGRRLFLGSRSGGLGLLENTFGHVGLVRRSLLEACLSDAGRGAAHEDPAWPLYARLLAGGARIVSVPDVLVRADGTSGRGRIGERSSDTLAVLRAYEAILPVGLGSVAAAVVAASIKRIPAAGAPLHQRIRAVWRDEGVGGVLRRIRRLADTTRRRAI